MSAPTAMSEQRNPPSADRPGGCPSSRARIALRGAAYAHLGEVLCEVVNGHATLAGEVPSYHLKQLAQETVRRIDGVQYIKNHLVVSAYA